MTDVQTATPLRTRTVVPALVVLIGLGVLVARSASHLAHPTFWAEDGQIFYSQGRLLGTSAIWEPYAGYLHLLPRLLEVPIVALPVVWGPTLSVWTATVVGTAMTASLLSPRLGWLIPSASWRAVLFVLVVLVPDQLETLNNMANLIFLGGIVLAVVALSDVPRSRGGRVVEVGAVAVLGLSGPIVVVLLPLFAFRVLRTRARHAGVTGAVAAACGAVQAVVYLLSPRTPPGGGSAEVLAHVVVSRGAGDWLFGPVLAARLLYRDGTLTCLAVLPIAWLVASVVVLGATRGWWTAGALAVTVVLLFAAPTWAYGTAMYGAFNYNRHVVVPMTLTLLGVVAAASTLGRGGSRRTWPGALAVVLLAAGAYGVTTQFPAQAWNQPTDTGYLQRCLRTPVPVCQTVISPGGGVWRIVVRGPAIE